MLPVCVFVLSRMKKNRLVKPAYQLLHYCFSNVFENISPNRHENNCQILEILGSTGNFISKHFFVTGPLQDGILHIFMGGDEV